MLSWFSHLHQLARPGPSFLALMRPPPGQLLLSVCSAVTVSLLKSPLQNIHSDHMRQDGKHEWHQPWQRGLRSVLLTETHQWEGSGSPRATWSMRHTLQALRQKQALVNLFTLT